MDDQQPRKKPLSEIGHLFLSDVRDRHLGGQPRPQRTPPGGAKASPPAPHAEEQAPQQPAPAAAMPSSFGRARHNVSIDLTPEEYAGVFDTAAAASPLAARRNPPITAVIGEHLNGKQFARVKEYARHLAAREGRVGLIELDAAGFRLMCFEPAAGEHNARAAASTPEPATAAGVAYDARAMAEAIEEMNFDVDRWLLLIPGPRVPEAQPLLALVGHWVLLSTCDHDGVVSSYRMLKGLADVHRPRLTLAVLDAPDEAQAARVHAKLAGVCQQFLDRTLGAEPPVRKEYAVAEHLVMLCRPTRDKAQLGNPPQWAIVEEFLGKGRAAQVAGREAAEAAEPRRVGGGDADDASSGSAEPAQRELVGDVVVSTGEAPAPEVMMTTEQISAAVEAPAPAAQAVIAPPAAPAAPQARTADGGVSDVLDLPTADATAEQIVSAVLRQDGSALLECPVRPPMCADARLAVTRDRGVVLLAVAGRGLNELRSIGQAYRWLVENRSLIGMAVPQLAIDPARAPHLRLLVDRSDANAEVLQPMLGGDHVTVQSYRRLKWGQKAGLLLEAA